MGLTECVFIFLAMLIGSGVGLWISGDGAAHLHTVAHVGITLLCSGIAGMFAFFVTGAAREDDTNESD